MAEGPSIFADSLAASANAELLAAFFASVLCGPSGEGAERFLAAEFRDHDPAGDDTGPEGVAAKLAALWLAFPDGRFEPIEIVAAGDRVAVRSRLSGTQAGPFGPLPASGRAIDIAFFDLYRVADGWIAEHWHVFDEAGLMRQLGQGV
ncbi:putative ester cyclase [Kaistia hirudinis]|uniref:Putative ester cyclase n=1 Tax=Kaistia hirudinis TaxID=1293440 RepID=A0A840AJK2_9HYPH|nr:ester cyclase [Kaistia hirudinis]MBB3929742.1 putative ester cyclase [Kaistia hirudinis]